MGTLYRQRRAGAVVLHGNGGVLPGLSDKTNGLPTDDMSMREDTRTKYSSRWDPRGEETATTEKSSEQQRRESGHRSEERSAAHAQVMGFTCVPRG